MFDLCAKSIHLHPFFDRKEAQRTSDQLEHRSIPPFLSIFFIHFTSSDLLLPLLLVDTAGISRPRACFGQAPFNDFHDTATSQSTFQQSRTLHALKAFRLSFFLRPLRLSSTPFNAIFAPLGASLDEAFYTIIGANLFTQPSHTFNVFQLFRRKRLPRSFSFLQDKVFLSTAGSSAR